MKKKYIHIGDIYSYSGKKSFNDLIEDNKTLLKRINIVLIIIAALLLLYLL